MDNKEKHAVENKEEYYIYGALLGIKINDLQRLKLLACNSKDKEIADLKKGIESILNSNQIKESRRRYLINLTK